LLGIPPLPRHGIAFCVRCRGSLETTSGRSVNAALACSLATLLLLVPVNTLPLLGANLWRARSELVIVTAFTDLWHQGWVVLAGLAVLLVIILPFVHFGLLSVVLGALRLNCRPRWLGVAFRWALWLERWAMVDVFLVSAGVGYYYLTAIEHLAISMESGSVCLIAAGILSMLSQASLERRAVWRAIGGEAQTARGDRTIGCRTCGLIQPLSREGARCPRCRVPLLARKRDSLAWTAALLAAAFILLFPAEIYPMTLTNLLRVHAGYTNFGYVRQLWHLGLWPVAVVAFWTGILTPALMMFSLAWCVLSVWRRSSRRLVRKTTLFRLVVESGRWSMTGPLSVAFFVPLLDFGPLGSEAASWGATAFITMTVLMMAASLTFDPRLMWDAALGASPRTGIAGEPAEVAHDARSPGLPSLGRSSDGAAPCRRASAIGHGGGSDDS
jgi:paraquat-inducible protein A